VQLQVGMLVKRHSEEHPFIQDHSSGTRSMITPFYPGLTCAAEGPLLDGTNPVPDSYFTATSEWSGSYAAHKARVGASNYWASTRADATTNPLTVYLQVSQTYCI